MTRFSPSQQTDFRDSLVLLTLCILRLRIDIRSPRRQFRLRLRGRTIGSEPATVIQCVGGADVVFYFIFIFLQIAYCYLDETGFLRACRGASTLEGVGCQVLGRQDTKSTLVSLGASILIFVKYFLFFQFAGAKESGFNTVKSFSVFLSTLRCCGFFSTESCIFQYSLQTVASW